MKKEHLQRITEEYNYIEKKYKEAREKYESISSQCDIINAELSLMNCFNCPQKEINQKREELKLLKDRLFDVQEIIQSLFITKLQKGIELQDKIYPCPAMQPKKSPIVKTLVK